MKKSVYILIFPILISCSNLNPNEYQAKSTKENIKCFEQLINELNSSQKLISEIIQVRKSKIRGSSDPIWVDQDYRLIESKELENLYSIEWKNKCLKSLKEDRDFKGLRYINKDSVIIEIDRFDRKTLSERYSKYGTTEIHRIVISKGKIQNKSYKFGGEKTMFVENFENGWIYEITQMPRH
jgi:hypothetical protein